MDELIKNDKGMVQIGEGRFVNEANLSEAGLASARAFAATKGVITSDSLTATAPLDIPSIPQPTTANGLIGEADAFVKSSQATSDLITEQERARVEAQNKASEQESTVRSLMDKALGVFQSGGAEEEAAGIPELAKERNVAQAESRSVRDQIIAARSAQNQELQSLQARGLTDIQLAQRVREIDRKYGLKLADLQVQGLFADARLQDVEANLLTAQSIVDRKIQLQLEPLKFQLDFEQQFLQRNYDLFDKADQRAFESKIRQDERQYNETREQLQILESTRLQLLASAAQQGAPMSVKQAIQMARTPQEAIMAAGQYGGDLLERQIKQMQLQMQRAQLKKFNIEVSNIDANTLAGAISPYQQERQTRILNSLDELGKRVSVATVGIASAFDFLPGSNPRNFKADLDSLKANIAFGELQAMREASKTGGALGQVSERELALLEASLAGLDQGQSVSNFNRNLQQVRESIERWQNAVAGINTNDIYQDANGNRYQKAADGLYYPI